MSAAPDRLDGVRFHDRPGAWDVILRQGRIADIVCSDGTGDGPLLLPAQVNIHAHLDKTLTAGRLPRRAATLREAIDVMEDDARRWTAEDLHARGTEALGRAFASGTVAMRSHIDWPGPEVPEGWRVACRLRAEWAGRVELSLAALTPLDVLARDGAAIAQAVAETGGTLGAFVYGGTEEEVETVLALARRFGLDLDFHVDEGLDPGLRGVDAIVAAAERHEMAGRVLCGHGCALSVRAPDEVGRLLGRAAAAGVGLVALPACNAWLQDHEAGRTPRLRGLAPVQEARAAGMAVMVGSDNVEDAFLPWGGYDMTEHLRLATLLGQLDPAEWLDAVSTVPGDWLGRSVALEPGARADFIEWPGATLDRVIADPRAPRIVWRDGAPLPQETAP